METLAPIILDSICGNPLPILLQLLSPFRVYVNENMKTNLVH